MRSPEVHTPVEVSQAAWTLAEGLLHEALCLPPPERRGFVEWRCGADLDLRDEVLSLLEADTGRLEALEEPLVDLQAPPPDETRIGPYRVLGELGRGGGGVVYLAERSDGAAGRRSAVKVLPRGLDSPWLRRRMRAERRILADLDHPNIARLHGGGTTDDGRPYLVMEHVDGERIDHHCRRLALPVRRRLELFLRVCRAVELAHGNRVIHRDLKPSNILVDRAGEPRLLDFGIAKVLGGAGARRGSDTTVGPSPMTLQYASPEQVEGGPVTPATDVYALGLVLYELLTGVRPVELAGAFGARARKRIREEEPVPPSAALRRRSGQASRETRYLAGDLDCVVLTALRKEPEHRYPSAGALADELDRHLRGLPVRARAAAIAYRAGRLVRRQGERLVVVLALASVLGLLVREHARQKRRSP